MHVEETARQADVYYNKQL